MDKKHWVIYGLIDPDTLEFRYVGMTHYFNRRVIYHKHSYKYESNHKARWIKGLANRGLEPLATVLESGEGNSWVEAEQCWIKGFRDAGCRLTNHTDGGEGVIGLKQSDEQRRRLVERLTGHVTSPETRKKIGNANRGQKRTAEQRKLMSEHRKGKPSPTIASAIAARRGAKNSREHLAKIAAKNGTPEAKAAKSEQLKKIWTERKADPEKMREHSEKLKATWEQRRTDKEWMEKRTEKLKSRVCTEETRAKLSAKLKGRVVSEETRRKISEGHKGKPKPHLGEALKKYWEDKRAGLR